MCFVAGTQVLAGLLVVNGAMSTRPGGQPVLQPAPHRREQPARYFDPDGLLSIDLFEIGGTKIGLSTDGYGGRVAATWEGAAVSAYHVGRAAAESAHTCELPSWRTMAPVP